MKSAPFPSTGHRSSHPLDLIHSDLCGPLATATPEGYRYWIVFICDATRYRVVMMLKKKSDAFAAFKLYKAHVENQTGRTIKALHDDKGGEYMSTEFNSFCDDSGIARLHTVRNRPQQNGDAENANQVMLNDITAMLSQANLPPSMWGRCLAAQVKVWNCMPTSALPGKTPYEAWYGKKPDLSRFRVFGCIAYVFVQKDKRKKLEPHMEKCIFLGYPPDYHAWLFYNPISKRYIISERAEFDERFFPGLSVKGLLQHDPLRLLNAPSAPVAADPEPLPSPPADDDNNDHPPPPAPAPAPAPSPRIRLPHLLLISLPLLPLGCPVGTESVQQLEFLHLSLLLPLLLLLLLLLLLPLLLLLLNLFPTLNIRQTLGGWMFVSTRNPHWHSLRVTVTAVTILEAMARLLDLLATLREILGRFRRL